MNEEFTRLEQRNDELTNEKGKFDKENDTMIAMLQQGRDPDIIFSCIQMNKERVKMIMDEIRENRNAMQTKETRMEKNELLLSTLQKYIYQLLILSSLQTIVFQYEPIQHSKE